MIVHFDISRERSIKAVEAAMLRRQEIFLVTQKDPETRESRKFQILYRVGTIAYIKQVVKLPHDLLRVLVEGRERAELYLLFRKKRFWKRKYPVPRRKGLNMQTLCGRLCTEEFMVCFISIVWKAARSAGSWQPRS